MEQQELKRIAARRAVEMVPDNSDIGLGSGSTAEIAIRLLGERVRQGLRIRGVPTSERVRRLAEEVGIPVTTLEAAPVLAITLDGADEVDPELNLVKGHGGALTREKIVASATRLEVILVDESKLVSRLGERSSVPVEVLPFGWTRARDEIASLGASPQLRVRDGQPFVTDNGNYILDLRTGPMPDPQALDSRLHAVVGVVETGLFLGMAGVVLVGGAEGVRELRLTR